MKLLALVAVVILIAGCGGVPGPEADPYSYDARLIEMYCAYGSVSRAQLNGCERHVGSDRIRRLDTNAARFAKGQIAECLRDAGPFCRDNAHP